MLAVKAMETLSLHKLCKQNQRDLVRSVERVRRKGIFISWFNLVHDDIPNLRKA